MLRKLIARLLGRQNVANQNDLRHLIVAKMAERGAYCAAHMTIDLSREFLVIKPTIEQVYQTMLDLEQEQAVHRLRDVYDDPYGVVFSLGSQP